jgi:hypothetical protein
MIKTSSSILFGLLNFSLLEDFHVSPPSKKRMFNGRLPSVKQQQRKASKVAAHRRARKLGHA